MVGSAMARDLAERYTVTVADRDARALDRLVTQVPVSTQVLDVIDGAELDSALVGKDLVINAVPGFLGFSTLRHIVDAGCRAVDITFAPEDMLQLGDRARETGARVVVDCGVAPGMGNLLLGYHDAHMVVARYECYVGGLPWKRVLPFQYRAPFSPVDVIEEYTRPARFLVHGREVVRPALSDPEFLVFDGIGTLEAFNTDGLRSLLRWTHIPHMIEKTLRYPGHRALMEALRDGGFFSSDPMQWRHGTLIPMEATAAMLLSAWQLKEDEDEYTVMRIRISGVENGVEVTHQYDLYDGTDHARGMSSMARTTGFTATAMATWMLDGGAIPAGVHPPEDLGRDGAVLDFILSYQEQRGVRYEHTRY